MAGNVSSRKAALRADFEARRRALTAAVLEVEGGRAEARLATLDCLVRARVVALYGAQPFELSVGRLATELTARGVACVYPRVVPGSKVLAFAALASPTLLELSPRGLPRPPADAPPVPLSAVDAFVVPGVAFGRDGTRLGRGGGYYDATLAAARPDAWRVGLCFDWALVGSVPTEAHDALVDLVVTSSTLVEVGVPGARVSAGGH